jgi:hypothetical protein
VAPDKNNSMKSSSCFPGDPDAVRVRDASLLGCSVNSEIVFIDRAIMIVALFYVNHGCYIPLILFFSFFKERGSRLIGKYI